MADARDKPVRATKAAGTGKRGGARPTTPPARPAVPIPFLVDADPVPAPISLIEALAAADLPPVALPLRKETAATDATVVEPVSEQPHAVADASPSEPDIVAPAEAFGALPDDLAPVDDAGEPPMDGNHGEADQPVGEAEQTIAEAGPAIADDASVLAEAEPAIANMNPAPVAAVPPAPAAPFFVPPAAVSAVQPAKESIMDALNTTAAYAQNAADTAADKGRALFADWNSRTREAMERSTKAFETLGDFYKGNLEALVESSRIAAKGLESFGQHAAEVTRKSLEDATTASKTLSQTKSPTEFLKLQGDYARSAFDTMVAETSRSTEAMLKLAGEVAQPVANRLAVAADKMKVAA